MSKFQNSKNPEDVIELKKPIEVLFEGLDLRSYRHLSHVIHNRKYRSAMAPWLSGRVPNHLKSRLFLRGARSRIKCKSSYLNSWQKWTGPADSNPKSSYPEPKHLFPSIEFQKCCFYLGLPILALLRPCRFYFVCSKSPRDLAPQLFQLPMKLWLQINQYPP